MKTDATSGQVQAVVRLLVTWPIFALGIPIAAWADASDADRPDLYPVRERIMYYLQAWWTWVRTGRWTSKRMILVEKPGVGTMPVKQECEVQADL